MPTNCVNRTKVVVRKLPSSYNSEEFLKYVSPLEENNYYHFVSGVKSGDQFSRAYFNFLNFEDTNLFKDRYDGYVFLDQKGEEFTAQVEYAPYQKIPSGRAKIDPVPGSIESDGEYLRFVESLKKAEETGKLTDALMENLEASKAKLEAEHDNTPLIDFMKNKEERKHGRDDKRLRRSDRSERSIRPPKSKPSRSRKERQRDRMSDRKSKSVAEILSKTEKDGKIGDKATETKGNTGDGKEIHVETIINNTKAADKRDAEGKNYNEDSNRQDRGRGRHSYEKQRKTLKQSNVEEFSKSHRTYEKSFSARDKPIKILSNPNKESVRSVKEVSKTDSGAGKTEVREIKASWKSEDKSERDEVRKERVVGKEGESAVKESADVKKASKEVILDKKPRVRNRDRPERAIYKPGPRRKE